MFQKPPWSPVRVPRHDPKWARWWAHPRGLLTCFADGTPILPGAALPTNNGAAVAWGSHIGYGRFGPALVLPTGGGVVPRLISSAVSYNPYFPGGGGNELTVAVLHEFTGVFGAYSGLYYVSNTSPTIYRAIANHAGGGGGMDIRGWFVVGGTQYNTTNLTRLYPGSGPVWHVLRWKSGGYGVLQRYDIQGRLLASAQTASTITGSLTVPSYSSLMRHMIGAGIYNDPISGAYDIVADLPIYLTDAELAQWFADPFGPWRDVRHIPIGAPAGASGGVGYFFSAMQALSPPAYSTVKSTPSPAFAPYQPSALPSGRKAGAGSSGLQQGNAGLQQASEKVGSAPGGTISAGVGSIAGATKVGAGEAAAGGVVDGIAYTLKAGSGEAVVADSPSMISRAVKESSGRSIASIISYISSHGEKGGIGEAIGYMVSSPSPSTFIEGRKSGNSHAAISSLTQSAAGYAKGGFSKAVVAAITYATFRGVKEGKVGVGFALSADGVSAVIDASKIGAGSPGVNVNIINEIVFGIHTGSGFAICGEKVDVLVSTSKGGSASTLIACWPIAVLGQLTIFPSAGRVLILLSEDLETLIVISDRAATAIELESD